MANYFKEALKPASRKLAVEKAIRDLTGVEFDTIVCRGISGAAIAPIVAYLMDKRIAFIRKGESSHSCMNVCGRVLAKFVIIDDFVDTGNTVDAILDQVKEYYPDAQCVGYWGYSSSRINNEQTAVAGLPWLVKKESAQWVTDYDKAAFDF